MKSAIKAAIIATGLLAVACLAASANEADADNLEGTVGIGRAALRAGDCAGPAEAGYRGTAEQSD